MAENSPAPAILTGIQAPLHRNCDNTALHDGTRGFAASVAVLHHCSDRDGGRRDYPDSMHRIYVFSLGEILAERLPEILPGDLQKVAR
jgi:hypothetical protein